MIRPSQLLGTRKNCSNKTWEALIFFIQLAAAITCRITVSSMPQSPPETQMTQSIPAVLSRWSDAALPAHSSRRNHSLTLGVLPGEGCGPEVINGALAVLRAVENRADLHFDIRFGGPIGRDAESQHGKPLSDEVVNFCQEIFSLGGAVLNGPGGGRYVYDLRKCFDLFFKISPLLVQPHALGACRLKPEAIQGVDILLVRENVSGVYQGGFKEGRRADGVRFVEHTFADDEPKVLRFLSAAARLARQRRGELTVVCKDSGVPGISALWRDCAAEVARANGIQYTMIDVDLMAYRLIQQAQTFDVIAAPNLCGDVLADLGAVLLGGRGISYSGNFDSTGAAVYQTNHGAGYDLAGKDQANPVGQIFSLAMLLRESFGLEEQASWIEQAVHSVWASGWRTQDIAEAGCKTVGTREISQRVADVIAATAHP